MTNLCLDKTTINFISNSLSSGCSYGLTAIPSIKWFSNSLQFFMKVLTCVFKKFMYTKIHEFKFYSKDFFKGSAFILNQSNSV